MNKELVVRLSKYYRTLHKLKAIGLEKVFSNNLGDAIGVTPALVRKDFSVLNIPGKKRGGYEITFLIDKLKQILGRDKQSEIIVVGCGRIGTALMQYHEFDSEGIRVIAGFDINPERVPKIRDIPIYHVNEMPGFIQENQIQVGIITVPDTAASGVLELMIQAGIRGILNFAAIELKQASSSPNFNPERCVIQNVNIGLELEQLFYQINAMSLNPPAK